MFWRRQHSVANERCSLVGSHLGCLWTSSFADGFGGDVKYFNNVAVPCSVFFFLCTVVVAVLEGDTICFCGGGFVCV